MDSKKYDFGDGANPGKIFVGGLARDTTLDTFVRYFEKYGEMTFSVIMRDRFTGQFRGFGFITYADPSVVDTVIAETHVINGKQVEIRKGIPKKPSNTQPAPAYGSDSGGRPYCDGFCGSGSYDSSFGIGSVGTASYERDFQ